MAAGIIRQVTPEEEELVQKREELTSVRAVLAERELELANLHGELKAFEGRYLREVGVLYAELDALDASIAELAAMLERSASARKRAQDARKRADNADEAVHGEEAKAPAFKPSAKLKSLYREAARRIHPDFARDDADRQRRTRFMAEANAAFSRGDAETLERILTEYQDGSDATAGEGVGAELIRTIRQIAQAKKRIEAIRQEMEQLRASELALLEQDCIAAEKQGRDLLAELAATVREQIARATKEHKTLAEEANRIYK